MNWKQILKIDLGALLRGGKPPHKGRRKRDWRGPLYVPTLLYAFFTVLTPIVAIVAFKALWEEPGMWYLVMPCVSLILPPVFLVLWWTERFLYYRRSHTTYVLAVLEGMVRCNVPLPEGLRHASLDAPNSRIASVLLALSDKMNMGAMLSEAMGPLTRFFPPGMTELVRLAELSGDLPETLASLVAEEEMTEAYSERWRGWAIYYGMYALTALPVALFVVIRVFPQFREVFADFGVGWPPIPLWLPFRPQSVAWVVLSVLGCAAGIYFLITVYSAAVSHPRNVASGRAGSLLAFLPYLRRMFFKHNLSVAATLTGKALQGGANLDEALGEAATAPIHRRFQRLFRVLSERVVQGQTLSEAFDAGGGQFPTSFTNMVRLGERSGMLAEAFEHIGMVYRSDVRRMTIVLVDVIAPLGIFLFGAIVLSVSFCLFGSMAMMADALSQAV
ncbi:MAG TPA: type II secretion system F family protein [Candidatus Hydrogenedentes bacterium]|nr:type II secretion system F family protein [Candidatus Hydrogenedentota bacterium]HQH51389.1 type II secretion system F family protein [Candidatus Hydrogenedentota bacterium]